MWGPECQQDGVATIGGITCIIKSLLGIIAPLLALAAVSTIIFAGIKMIMGADNPKEVQTAQQMLTFAIIGIVGLGLSWLILIVIKAVTGVDVLQLNFPQ